MRNPGFVLETKNGHEHRARSDALISLGVHATFTASEYFMKVLFEISNILKLVYDCIQKKINTKVRKRVQHFDLEAPTPSLINLKHLDM